MHIGKLLLMIFILCLIAGCAKPAEETPVSLPSSAEEERDPYEARAQGILDTLSAQEKIEQMMILSARVFEGENVTELQDPLKTQLEEHPYGGFILFGENVETRAQLCSLTHDLQTAAEKAGIPYLIGIDQEGGRVERIPFMTHLPGNMAIGAAGNPQLSEAVGKLTGSELAALGINADFAPCADINSEVNNPIIGLRSFSDNPTVVAENSVRFYKGLKDAGVAACGKHFPGHGDTDTDSHTSLPVIRKTKAEIEQMELVPFAALSKAEVPMIMSAHICFPEVEKETYVSVKDGETITLPATLSRTVLTGILREELCYDGVVVTDSLVMDAIREHFDLCDAIVLAINAGADFILMPMNLENAESLEELNALSEKVCERIGKDLSEERIDESVLRILKMKAEYGILDQELPEAEVMTAAAEKLVGSPENHASVRAAADQSVTVLKNENDILPLKEGARVLFAGVNDQEVFGLKYGMEQLFSDGYSSFDADYVNYEWGRNTEPVLEGLEDHDCVVITSWLDNMTQFDPEESAMIPFVEQVIEASFEAGKPCIVISAALPYDLPCYKEADALIAVYNPYGTGADEEGNPVGESRPGLPAALDIIFGFARPSGTLPVTVYEIADKKPGTETAYERGSGLTW